MRLLMPIDGWFSQTDHLQDVYQGLKQSEDVRGSWHSSKEWKSLSSIEWSECLLLPFASEAARVASLCFKELMQDHWPNRLIFLEDLNIDPSGNTFKDLAFIGSYIVKLWDLWKGRTTETILSLVCCPNDLVAISLLAAAMDGVPIYCFSEALQKSICIPGWEMPFLNDQKRKWLKDLLEGAYLRVESQSFLSKWLPVVGMKQRTITGEIIRERLQWESKEILDLPPSPF